MTYSQKLRDPRWQRKRLQILERDNFTCLSCRSTDRNLQVHHVVYERREPWDYPDYLYQTLCEVCHKERQEIVDRIVSALRVALKDVPTVRLEVVSNRICAEAMDEIGLCVDGQQTC